MPPSGFYDRHSSAIVHFLDACVQDLIIENQSVRTPIEAIQREISHIDQDTRDVKRSAVSTSLLGFTRNFYQSLLEKKPKTYESLKQASKNLLVEIKSEIESIKVIDQIGV